MLVFTNKCCEVLPIEDLSKIKIKSRINTLTYIVDDGKQKYRKNNFTHPRNADKEYPLMIIVDNKFKRLFCCGDDKNAINLRNELVSDTVVMRDDDCYKYIYKMKRKIKLKIWFQEKKERLKLFFLGLWYAGIRNKKINVKIPEFTLENLAPDFYNYFVITDSIMKKAKEIKQKLIEVNDDEKKFMALLIKDEA